MTDYTKSTNFTSKDTLPTGSALKIIKGAEFDTEFNAIATAIATKYDSNATVPVANGGTGATTASAARTNLGLVIGTNVQAWDADLDTWATKTAPSGTVVGTTDTQTLTNKTLTSPTIGGTPVMNASVVSSGTAVSSTSGTSIDFTSIPSWVKRITVMFNGVSTNGGNNLRVQLGTSGGVETSGYNGVSGWVGATSTALSFSSGFDSYGDGGASIGRFGTYTFTLIGSNVWTLNGMFSGGSGTVYIYAITGAKTLAGTLDRVRITTVGSTDTFDAGSINILYE